MTSPQQPTVLSHPAKPCRSRAPIMQSAARRTGFPLQHAIRIAKQIDYLGGTPAVMPKPVKTLNDPVKMLRADLENERETVGRYRERICQAEAMGEFALSQMCSQ